MSFDVAAVMKSKQSVVFPGPPGHFCGRRLVGLGKGVQQTIRTCCVYVLLRGTFFSWGLRLEAADGLQIWSQESGRGPG